MNFFLLHQESKELASEVVAAGKTDQSADGSSKPTSNGTPSTGKQDHLVKKRPIKLKRGFLIRQSKRADSRVGAEPDSSLSPKEDKSKSELDSINNTSGEKQNSSDATEPNSLPTIMEDKSKSEPVPRKRGEKKKASKNPEKGHSASADSRSIAETNSSLSIKEEKSERELEAAHSGSLAVKAHKSENEPDSVPRKRGRKPNSLMNPDEGYDQSWLWSGRNIARYSRCRKSREKIPITSPSGDSVSKKVTSASTLENVAEPTGLQSRLDQTTTGATLIQEADTTSLSVIKGESLRAEVEEKTPRNEPEDTISAEEKEQKNSEKLELSAKTSVETAVASEHEVVQMETEDPHHPEEKLQQSTVKLEATNVSKKSSVKRDHKGRKSVNGSANKDIGEASSLKVKHDQCK